MNLTRECLDYGSKVVGGVTPGRKGREVHGVPVFDTVEQAVEHHGAPIDGAVVTVPPAFTKDAVMEAIENGVKLIVVVTERIPRRDVAEMVELANLRGARIIGPNCLGLIVPGVCKMGGIGGPAKDAAKAYSPGPVGVMSRSGGMTTEISSSLTAAGLGVSTAVSIGGDAIIGSTYAELMPYFEEDEQTEAIVIYTEPGGRMEAELVDWREEAGSKLPIVAFMAGKFMDDEEMQGMSFGHAGTIVEGKEDSATEKIARLEAAGIPVVERIDEIPDAGQGERWGLRGREAERTASSSTSRSTPPSPTDPELAKKLEEACPVDIFAASDSGRRGRRGEPRRVRALRPLPGRRAGRHRDRHQALRRDDARALRQCAGVCDAEHVRPRSRSRTDLTGRQNRTGAMKDNRDSTTGRGLAAVYYGAAKLGLSLAFETPSVTAVWAPTGIALAALVLFGVPAVARRRARRVPRQRLDRRAAPRRARDHRRQHARGARRRLPAAAASSTSGRRSTG